MSKKKPVKMSKKDAIDTIVKHKANKLKGDKTYEVHIRNVLKLRQIGFNNKTMEAFKMGAVDAMIYDVAPTLGFRASHKKRIEILTKIFPKCKSKKRTS